MRARKSSIRSFGAEAPRPPTYAGYSVGQEVFVKRNAKTTAVSFRGIINALIIPEIGWKFAVVEDDLGGSHAVDFEELMA